MSDQFPDDWKAQIAGDSDDNLKSLEGFESPVEFGAAYFKQSVDAATAAEALKNANWRAPFVGDDEKYAKRMEKFTTQEDYGKNFREMETLISAGELLKPLPENATEDDIKAFREQQGIPLEVKDYLENLPEGLVIGEDDKPIVADFMNTLHKLNVPPAVGHAAIEWYNKFQEEQGAAIAEQDKSHEDETTDALRERWGSEYRLNINIAKGALAELPEEKRDMFLDARMNDNRALFNDAEVMGWLAGVGRKINPTATIVGAGGGDSKTVDTRIAEIEATMGTPAYIKNPKVQEELKGLYTIRDQDKAA